MMSQQPRAPFSIPGIGGAAQFVQTLNRRPSPAAKAAMLVFLLVIAVPVVLLILAAGVISGVVYVVLTVLTSLANTISGSRKEGPPPRPGEDDQGRRNVRVKS